MKINVRAKQNQIIRVNRGEEKTEVKKGNVVSIDESQIFYFLANNFERCDDDLKDGEIQTTDASTKKVVSKRGKVSKSNTK